LTYKNFKKKLNIIFSISRLYPFVYEWVYSKGGSISAEHGIGHVKRTFHHNLVNPKIREISSSIKKLFDPKGILSPYKMIDF